MRSYGQYCSVAKALDVVGDRWTLLIIRELLLQGPCRYTDLRNGLPGIATNLLADRPARHAPPPRPTDPPPGPPPAVVEVRQGGVRPRPGSAESPDLVLEGPPRIILGLLGAFVTPAQAQERGLVLTGDPALLRRLQPANSG